MSAWRVKSVDVAARRVADGDGRVAPRPFLQEQQGHRLADDLRTAEDHRVRPPRLDPRGDEQLADAQRACRGRTEGAPIASRPAFSGWKPSTSFRGSTRSITARSSIWAGRGSWTRIPWTSGSALRRVDRRQELRLGRRRRGAGAGPAHPGGLAGVLLVPDVDLAGRVLADQDDRQAGHAAGRGPEARRPRPATSSRIDWAIALPSRMRAANGDRSGRESSEPGSPGPVGPELL